ncbi:hypothetical protein O7A70_13705 [Mesorhizobium sp. Cs1299R1N1]|uniref:hypothetical protein n=1 Tax=Mesorhizobium sp. Cs1299R1N1 TaxID=3015172 RepID=UPI00301DC7B1
MNAPVGTLKPYGIPDGLDPRAWRKAIQARVNELLDQSMALITALDVMEADCDLEPSGDELDASATHGWAKGGDWNEDSEQEDSGFGDQDGMNEDCTGEPSLGWTVATNQDHAMTRSAGWALDDGEQDAGDMPEGPPHD